MDTPIQWQSLESGKEEKKLSLIYIYKSFANYGNNVRITMDSHILIVFYD